ncbi:hypothetical protein UZ38_29380 [Bacillus amyloliquefaciens]|nr:hypothetical protein D5285_17120 [Bacillus paralicheniformis]KJD54054.1 hypothetical protein UZ38_29380 [Bacillus amyloliquefaciens]KUL10045.1 hypothetical protein LI7559_10570 [Bacillus licheniformis LMG 7559]QFY37595.1 hypothetical protein D2B33_03650 [Bacillus paralicheniformis]
MPPEKSGIDLKSALSLLSYFCMFFILTKEIQMSKSNFFSNGLSPCELCIHIKFKKNNQTDSL